MKNRKMERGKISSVMSRTDVTALCFKRGYIFAGIGNRLYITKKSNKSVQIINALEKETIFNIKFSSKENKMLVSGGNTFVIFTFNFDNGSCKKLTCNNCYPDWILTVEWINDNNSIAAVSMHNKLVIWNCENFEEVSESVCEERCIIYSAHIAGRKWRQLVIMSGTVFNEILIWCPHHDKSKNLCPVLTRLQGHQGVIFSVDYNPHVGLICSTSDDRSLKVWQTENNDFSTCMINNNSVKLKHTLYGHSSRVFRCKILENFIITAGEDSLLNLWDFDGKCEGKLKTQDGNCIWALDCNNKDESEIIVGGSDSGVTIFPIITHLLRSKVNCVINPIKINYMKSGNLVVLSDKGSLYYHDIKANKLVSINSHEDLRKYSLMEVSQCRKLLSLCGYEGNVHIYKETSHGLEYVCFYEIPDLGRVFSFHWLTCNTFLCCSRNGTLSLWELKKRDKCRVVLRSVFKLPKSQQRWSTAAIFCGENHLVVGDRKGNVHLFNLNRLFPVQTIKKAHNHLGITHLSYSNINRNVLSLGANGIIKTYNFDGGLLSPACSDKLPMSWLEKLSVCDNFLIILSFRGDVFTVWDVQSRRTIVEIKCGGRHRSWDFMASSNDLKFSYLKDKTIFLHDYKKCSVFPIEIIGGFHTKEINACQLIVFDNNATNYLLVSGGEDTTLKLSIGCFNKTGQFETVSTFKSHLSSIRCVRCIKRTTFGDIVEFSLFTAGGRCQIITWNLRISLRNGKIAHVDCKQLHSYHETNNKELEPETRIMDLSVFNLYLIAACSDGSLLIFLHNNRQNGQMKYIRRVYLSKPKCITKLLYKKILETDVLICSLTSGDVMFVDLRNIIDDYDSEKEYFSFKTFKLHQNAINSIVLNKINENRFLLVTGGDDNSINASLLQFSNNDNRVEIITSCYNNSVHCAQVTGLALSDNRLFSVSIDQKFVVYDLKIDENKLDFKKYDHFSISVPDAQGMEFYKSNESCYALCFGRGIEMLKITT